MLWIEGRLSRLERLSMASFIACGHPVELYTYGLDNDPPPGVMVREATEILPATARFNYRGAIGYDSLATFSNLFRYTLLYERGGIWCDADIVCLKPLLFAADIPMFISSELAIDQSGGKAQPQAKINSGAIQVPARHRLMEVCIDRYHRIDQTKMQWGDAGPGLVGSVVKELNLAQHVLHPDIFCPVPHWETTSLLFGARTITPSAYAVHFWNEILRWNFFDKNVRYDMHSLYERLCRHYLRDSNGN